ncbi:MAG TPA: TPM domain-containing protein, partial [Longimicrobiaceae bacterium]|nr:TPM domain-containing protein [Longimicrobiaceae bacterium]
MKPLRTLAALLAAAAVLRAAPAAPQGYPTPTGEAVTDLAGVLDGAQEDSLTSLLARLRGETGVDARVLTIRSLGDYRTGDPDLQRFANRLMNAWEVGDAQRKDGALVVLAVADREVWVALGAKYGPSFDERMQGVVETEMVPRFREGAYGAGVVDGVR